MPNPDPKMTRQEMQNEALAIETLLDAAIALLGASTPTDAHEVLDLAHGRAQRLHIALDSVNTVEEAA